MDLESIYVTQDYDNYTDEDHEVWQTLCKRQNDALRGKACRQFYEGLDKIQLDFERVPNLDDINRRISPITGWKARAVPGYIDSRYFFLSLQREWYPTTTSLRSKNNIDYIEEPDIFHDVFGHVALQADEKYGEVMRTMGSINDLSISDQDVLEITRLFWFTVEFGLIREGGEAKILGSGLLSSPGEALHCLSDGVERRPFRLAEVIAKPFRIDIFQDVYYVAESLEQLIEAAHALIYQIKERNAIRWRGQKNTKSSR